MQVLVDVEGIDMYRRSDLVGLQLVFILVSEGIHCTDKGRDITSGFPRKVIIDGPEIFVAAAPADGFVDVARTAVVGRDCQIPVTEYPVGIFEVSCCRIRRFDRIQALVHEGVDDQTIGFSRRVHELPHSFRTSPGDGNRIQGRFDHGHVFEFLRHVIFVEGLFKDRHVIFGQSEHLAHFGRHLL